jgi:hypothetical protein
MAGIIRIVYRTGDAATAELHTGGNASITVKIIMEEEEVSTPPLTMAHHKTLNSKLGHRTQEPSPQTLAQIADFLTNIFLNAELDRSHADAVTGEGILFAIAEVPAPSTIINEGGRVVV